MTSCINFSKCAGGFPKVPALLAACLARCCTAPLCSLIYHCIHLLLSPQSLSDIPVVFRSLVAAPFGSVTRVPFDPFSSGQASCGCTFSSFYPTVVSFLSLRRRLPQPCCHALQLRLHFLSVWTRTFHHCAHASDTPASYGIPAAVYHALSPKRRTKNP